MRGFHPSSPAWCHPLSLLISARFSLLYFLVYKPKKDSGGIIRSSSYALSFPSSFSSLCTDSALLRQSDQDAGGSDSPNGFARLNAPGYLDGAYRQVPTRYKLVRRWSFAGENLYVNASLLSKQSATDLSSSLFLLLFSSLATPRTPSDIASLLGTLLSRTPPAKLNTSLLPTSTSNFVACTRCRSSALVVVPVPVDVVRSRSRREVAVAFAERGGEGREKEEKEVEEVDMLEDGGRARGGGGRLSRLPGEEVPSLMKGTTDDGDPSL